MAQGMATDATERVPPINGGDDQLEGHPAAAGSWPSLGNTA
jgi:hypothetical protein